jgi:HAD superfamily hydrolase (TIGR01509 family)
MDPIDTGAIVFDMDGLLVDSEPLWAEVEADFAHSRGADFTSEMGRACVGKGLANTLRVMHEAFGFEIDVERDTREIIDRFIVRAGEVTLKPGARELIEAAERVVPMALGSSSERRLIRAVLEAVGLTRRLRVVVGGDAVARPKPAPDIFLRCAELLGVTASRAVVLEDSLAGVHAARSAGMRVIAVPEGDPMGRGFDGLCDAVVPDLFEARRRMRFVPCEGAAELGKSALSWKG